MTDLMKLTIGNLNSYMQDTTHDITLNRVEQDFCVAIIFFAYVAQIKERLFKFKISNVFRGKTHKEKILYAKLDSQCCQ